MKKHLGIKAIALFEAVKGVVVPVVVFRMLPYLSNHAQEVAESLVERLHLNPASELPATLVRKFNEIQDHKIWLVLLMLAYAATRFVEAYGLWFQRRWAEWLAVFCAAVYLPIEILELTKSFNLLVFLIFIVNLLIVLYLSRELWKKSDAT